MKCYIINHLESHYRLFCRPWWMYVLSTPVNIYRQLRDFIQRGRRGWANTDVINLFDYHLHVLHAMMESYQKNKTGYPGNTTWEEYESVIGEILNGLNAMKALSSDDPNQSAEDQDKLLEDFKAGMKLFTEHYLSFWT